MHSLNLRLALFFAMVLVIAGLCVCSVNHQVKEALAGLLPKPVPVLAWNGGERRLDDLLK